MIERLYRGKRIDNGEWVYGFYFCMYHDDDREHLHHFIIPLNVSIPKDRPIGEIQVEVDPETVGQCVSGLPGKNGKKIFEGDILKAVHYFHGSRDEFKKKKIRKAYGKAIENKDSYLEEFTYFRNYVVEYSAKKCAWIGRNGSDQHELISLTNYFHKGAVIGNVHDNPELLEHYGD